MDLCIYGAGAVGGHLAARLAHRDAAHHVSVVARGDHLAAIRRDGLTLIGDEHPGRKLTVRLRGATAQPRELALQDVVFVTLKATALGGAAADIGRLLKPQGVAVFITNGIPWWWNYGLQGGTDTALPMTRAQALLWEHVTPERALGCIAVSSNVVEAPGVIRHMGGNRWILGEPAGGASSRLANVRDLLADAGLQAVACDDIREEVWRKLLVNVPNHALASLTRLNTHAVHEDPALCALAHRLATEVTAIAAAHGHDLGAITLEDIRSRVRPLARGARSSMLQDVLAGRPLEVDTVFGAVCELARIKQVPADSLHTVHALLRGLDRSLKAS